MVEMFGIQLATVQTEILESGVYLKENEIATTASF